MKQLAIITISIILVGILSACSTIKSTTYIEPDKSFVLGVNKHGDFKASVKNSGSTTIEIYTIAENGEEKLVSTLDKEENGFFKLEKNIGVRFKNLSNKTTAKIEIKAKGESNLSMGYSPS